MTMLETPRLRLRMFREDDFDNYADMMADPEVMRYLPQGGPLPRPEAWRNMWATGNCLVSAPGQLRRRTAANSWGASVPSVRQPSRAWN